MWLFFNLVVHGQQCGLLAVCLSVFLFMLHFLHSVVIALHPLFAGMVIGAFRASLQAVDLAATAQYH